MNTKEFQSAAIINMDSAIGEIRDLKRIVRAVEVRVENIAPQSHLHPIPRPTQKEVGRDLNVASWFRLETKEENAKLPENATRKYLEFPENMSDEQLNEEMKKYMYYIICERLKPGWETKNWNMIYNSDKMLGEQIVKEAALRPEMAVIAQSSGYWAIRKIAEQRQKSTKRSAEQRNARVRIKKENKGAFGSRDRVKKSEIFEENEETNKSGTSSEKEEGDGEKCAKQVHDVTIPDNAKVQDVVNSPAIRMTDEAVSVVEDLGPSEASEEEMEITAPTDEPEFIPNAKEQVANDSAVSQENQKVMNESLAMLKSLTKEQIIALLSNNEIEPTEKEAATVHHTAKASSCNVKRKSKDNDCVSGSATVKRGSGRIATRTGRVKKTTATAVQKQKAANSKKSRR